MSKAKTTKPKKLVESITKITFDQFFERAEFLGDIPGYERLDLLKFFGSKNIDFKSDLDTFEKALKNYKES